MRYLVLTTINEPIKILRFIANKAYRNNIRTIIVGDKKTPKNFKLNNSIYLDLEHQYEIFGEFASALPINHYSRKNIGYLYAIKSGSNIIQETDDDNIPYNEFWFEPENPKFLAKGKKGWVNVFDYFSDEKIWPRGYPLEEVNSSRKIELTRFTGEKFSVYQGMIDENPDVDAIYRLTRKLPFYFKKKPAVLLKNGYWCPFNSQNTIFKPEAFIFMYLPSFCSFRMTDIWRSFIAQRCLWEEDSGVVFHSATVYQKRNKHNLLKDFADEISGYLFNEKIKRILQNLSLNKNNSHRNLYKCYEALCKEKILPKEELKLVKSWIKLIEKLMQ